MPKIRVSNIVAGLFVAATFSTLAQAEAILVQDPWARETAASAKNGAAYMVIMNHGDSEEVLLSGKSDVAERVEVHGHEMIDGVMKMRPVENGIPLAPGGDAKLEPGGLHMMIMGLNAPLTEGESFPLTLVFESGTEVTVDVAITDIRGPEADRTHKLEHGDHGNHDKNTN